MSVYDPAQAQAAMDWDKVFGVLVECCGANEEQRGEFLAYMHRKTDSHEYRFCGWLGMGGKLYVNSQGVYVDCYAEQKSPIVAFAIKVANERIQTLLKSARRESLAVDEESLHRGIDVAFQNDWVADLEDVDDNVEIMKNIIRAIFEE